MKMYGLSIRDTTRVSGIHLIVIKDHRPVDAAYVMEFQLDGINRHAYVNKNVGLVIEDKWLCAITSTRREVL